MSTRSDIYSALQRRRANDQPAFAVLADPDSMSPAEMEALATLCNDARVDYLLVGGSLLVNGAMDACIQRFKAGSDIPVLIFPGSPAQVSPYADALLYLSLISGRNPELLIGAHVTSAPAVKASGLEVISTGYMVVDGGAPTTVSYMSGSAPLPRNKPDIALCTAWAGELLGMKTLYMDAGSGARFPLSEEMIAKVAAHTSAPLFVGGGIRTPEGVSAAANAGATVVVVGNAIEKDPFLIRDMAAAVRGSGPRVTQTS